MRKTQLVALLLVAIMAVAIIPTAAVAVREVKPAPSVQSTTIVGASRIPSLDVHRYPTWPYRDQRYEVFGYFYFRISSNTISLLPSKALYIYWKYPGETSYHYWTWIRTDAYGDFKFTDHEGGQPYVDYKIEFRGDSTYYARSWYYRVYNGKTTTSISSSVSDPTPNQVFSIRGYVKKGDGTGFAGVPVNVYYRYWAVTGWSSWYLRGARNTGTGGYYSINISGETRACQYYAIYQGYPTRATSLYWKSQSPIIYVDSRYP